jgi:small subunit ribosomal protein S13
MNQELNEKKPICYSLQGIFGIGNVYSNYVSKKVGFSKSTTFLMLSEEQVLLLVNVLEKQKLKISKDLKEKNYIAIKRLVNIKTYRGIRLIKNLPVRGQRTRTNSKTAKKLNRL